MAEIFAEENNLIFKECSAKTGMGVEDIFEEIIKMSIERK